MATHPRTRTRRRVHDRRPAAYDAPPPPPPPPAPTWRDDVMSLSGLNLIAGIWLIIAPWVLGYNAGDPKWNDVVFGAIVALLALTKISGALRASWLSFINAAIGVWLVVSAFTIDQSATAGWNDIILGVIVFALGIGSAAASERAPAPPVA